MSTEGEERLAEWAASAGFWDNQSDQHEEYVSPEQHWQRKHANALRDVVESSVAQAGGDIIREADAFFAGGARDAYVKAQVDRVAHTARLAFEAGISFSQSFNA